MEGPAEWVREPPCDLFLAPGLSLGSAGCRWHVTLPSPPASWTADCPGPRPRPSGPWGAGSVCGSGPPWTCSAEALPAVPAGGAGGQGGLVTLTLTLWPGDTPHPRCASRTGHLLWPQPPHVTPAARLPDRVPPGQRGSGRGRRFSPASLSWERGVRFSSIDQQVDASQA